MSSVLYNQPKKQYVPPAVFKAEYAKAIEAGKPTDKLLEYFQKIAKHYATTFIYKNKCDCDAVVNYALTEAWRKWDKYDEQKSDNIFSFFTTMIANDIRLHYKKITKGKKVNISIDALYANNSD